MHSPVRQKIIEEIRSAGPIPFRRFMEMALYDPDGGYYTGDLEKIGPAGDFITSPEISPLFGAAIARQLQEMWRLLDEPQPFYVIEFGPGRGALAASILQASRNDEAFLCALRYGLVETSPSLRRLQQDKLKDFGQTFWLTEDQLPPDFAGVILSNEFVDALPVHRVKFQDGRLQEIHTALDDQGDLTDLLAPPSTPQLQAYFDALGITLEEGQEAEVNLLALEWFQKAAQALGRGFFLTIDYGYPAHELYAPHRNRGTLLGYHRHQTVDAPYQHVGSMDLTAHVDFTSLHRLGEQLGLVTLGFTNQQWFLLSSGILQEFAGPPATPEDFRRLQAIKKLLMPGGMGEIFKILLQAKNAGRPSLLGLQEKPSPTSPSWRL